MQSKNRYKTLKSQKVILLLGGNSENTFHIMEKAVLLLQKEIGLLIKDSAIYQTAAWGPVPQPDFLNKVIILNTNLPPVYLLKKLLLIETRLGRRRTLKYGPRTIDIDLLFYGRRIIKHKDLIVPHPEIQNRKFVLLPCNEIIPRFMHPVFNMTIQNLLNVTKDTLDVKKWKR